MSRGPSRTGLRRFAFSLSILFTAALCGCTGGGSAPASTDQTPTPQTNPTPAINSISPSSAPAGASSITVTVTGSGFVQGSTVDWNQSGQPTTFVNSTQLQVTVSAADLATAGSAQIVVMNPTPGGGSSSAAAFTINNPAPTIASLSQSSIMAGSAGITLGISGTGFVETSTAQWNQSNRPTTFVNSTQLQVALTTADLAVGEVAQITVVNSTPGGGVATAAAFTIDNPLPQILSVSPSSVTTISGGLIMTVTGSGFVSNSSITWSGVNRTTNYVSNTDLQVTLSASDVTSVGTVQIGVSNPAPGGGSSASTQPLIIGYPSPLISFLAPSSAIVGGTGFTLFVNGIGFAPASVVQWNGTDCATTYVNSSKLGCAVTAAEIATVGTAEITVVTPPPGGGTSNRVTLNITTYPPVTLTGISPSSVPVNSPDTVVRIT